ncbi:MAG: GatB/YqeY domain-containing protein [Candidatus Berkelbacteria bacterium]|nr:GatB/YqeY domain-containing protein [Candidatus Berkelbacteria bacterium]
MSQLDWINQEIIKDYKSGNAERRVFLQTIKAALINKTKESGSQISEEDEIKVLKSEMKQRQEAVEQYKQANRQDLVDKVQKEVDILKGILPQDLSDEEIEKTVKEKIDSSEDKSFGSIMKESMAELKGRADGSRVSQIVKKLIES